MLNEAQILSIIGRDKSLLDADITNLENQIQELVSNSKFLVVGAAGTIGSSVSLEIAKRNPQALCLVDISENNLVELIRNVRSTSTSNSSNCRSFALDFGSTEFQEMFKEQGPFDYVLNLAALKHVRSEKDTFTLSRMFKVNILNPLKLQKLCGELDSCKYFCVSTDKAANPANLMGASKLIMEKLLLSKFANVTTSFARFANVAFSDGSLPHGFLNRIENNQPLSAPYDISRYFITKLEAGQICLLSTLFGQDGEIFYPKLDLVKNQMSFKNLAENFLRVLGFEPKLAFSERESLDMSATRMGHETWWPCYFFESDTTGEKPLEEFYTNDEIRDETKYFNIGVVKKSREDQNTVKILDKISNSYETYTPSKADFINLVLEISPNFQHSEKGKFLDDKM